MAIRTQDLAQRTLPRQDKVMVKKDNIHAHFGSMQNRLENTVLNLSIFCLSESVRSEAPNALWSPEAQPLAG